MLGFNVRFQVIPSRALPARYEKALKTWVENTRPRDRILTLGDLTPALRFVVGRPFTLSRVEMASIEDFWNALYQAEEEGASFYVADTQVAVGPALGRRQGVPSEESRAVLQKCRREEAFTYANDYDGAITHVYRVRSFEK